MQDASLIFISSLLASGLGALFGVGGGFLLVPLLTLYLNIDYMVAVGLSLFAVMATSLAGSSRLLLTDFVSTRLALRFSFVCVLGALIGLALRPLFDIHILFLFFSILLFYSALSPWMTSYRDEKIAPLARFSPLSYALFLGAGITSILLGIGGGVLKVLAFDRFLGFSLKHSAATSNFMIGITAWIGSVAALTQSALALDLLPIVVVGVLIGTNIGAAILPLLSQSHLRYLSTTILMIMAIQMGIQGLSL